MPQKAPKKFLSTTISSIQKTLKENETKGEKYPGIIPRSWELTKLSASGDMTCVKRGVLAFDIDANGHIIYSNGKHLIKIFLTAMRRSWPQFPLSPAQAQ